MIFVVSVNITIILLTFFFDLINLSIFVFKIILPYGFYPSIWLLISFPSTNSSKISSNLFYSNRLSGILCYFPPIHLLVSGEGNIGSIAILLYFNILHYILNHIWYKSC